MVRKNKLFDSSREFQICWAVYKKYFKCFKNDIYDFISAGYVSILELSKKYNVYNRNLSEKEIGTYFYRFALSGMSQFAKTINIKNVSLSLPIGSDICLADALEDNSLSLCDDSKRILLNFFELLKSYDLQSQTIIKDYILNNLSISEIYKKYKLNKYKLCSLIREFRSRLFDILNIDSSFNNLFVASDEFTKFELNKDRVKNKKSGLAISGDYEYKIYRLLKDFAPGDVSHFLGISEKSYNSILNCFHNTTKAKKLHLWQIQKLRLKFFPKYTLQELCLVGG